MVDGHIGRYRIVRPLGAGAMGEVFVAEDPDLRRQVAIKVIHSAVAGSEVARKRFRREARALAALNVPGVVTIHEIGVHDDREYIVMELIDGRSLREEVIAGLALPDLLRLIAEVARALAETHAAGVLHRDVKPDNIMVTRAGKAKVVDFGIALKEQETPLLSDDARTMSNPLRTHAGMVVGTPAYMSPEVLGGGDASEATDTYALGTTLHELVSGQLPFEGDTLPEALKRVASKEPPPRLDEEGLVAKPVADLVARMLDPDPEARPSMLEVAAALDEWTEAATRASASPPAAGAALGELPTADATTVAPPPRPSRRWAVLVVAAATVAAAGAGAVRLIREAPETSPPSHPEAMDPEPRGALVLAVAPLEVEVEGLEAERSEGLAQVLATLLRHAPELRVLSPQDLRSMVSEFLTSTPAWERVAEGAGATHLLEGRVVADEGGATGTLHLRGIGEHDDLEIRVEGADVDATLTELAQATFVRLGLEATAPAAATHTMSGLAAYELGARALADQQWPAAITHLERAVESDPEFFEAWYYLALARSWAPMEADEILAAANRAGELATTRRDRILVEALRAYFSYDYDHGVEILTPLHEENPRDRDIGYTLGEVQYHSGRYREGIDTFERVMRSAPGFKIALLHPLAYAIGLRRFDAARDYERLMRAEPDVPTRYAAEIAFAEGRFGDAAEEGQPIDMRVGALVLMGRGDEADALVDTTYPRGTAERGVHHAARAYAVGDRARGDRLARAVIVGVRRERGVHGWRLLRSLAEVLIAADAEGPLRELYPLAVEETPELVVRWFIGAHAPALVHDLEPVPREEMPEALRALADGAAHERAGRHREAVETWRSYLDDPSGAGSFLEHVAIRRNLIALGDDAGAEAECDAMRAPARYRAVVIVSRAVCDAAAEPPEPD